MTLFTDLFNSEDELAELPYARRRHFNRKSDRRDKHAEKNAKRDPQRSMRFRRFLDQRKNRFKRRVRDGGTNAFDWRADEVFWCHVGLLRTTIRQIMETDINSEIWVDIVTWLEDTSVRPFSFNACHACAVQDHTWPFAHKDRDEMRSNMLKLARMSLAERKALMSRYYGEAESAAAA